MEPQPIITLLLPWPPTINHHYCYGKRNVRISTKGKTFRDNVYIAVLSGHPGWKTLHCRLSVDIMLCQPDKRKRDIDNYIKPLLDALTHARIWHDDSQIDMLSCYRGATLKNGCCIVCVKPFLES
jgi:crossover junction endodeoxyribonuclease RusA